jgi:prophage DNA circulation protein
MVAGIATIRDLSRFSGWRSKLLPAHFAGRLFHVETGSRENGRSIVLHEFPKKDFPYAEDMGKRAVEFTVRGYCIQYPMDTSIPLYMRDYTVARDQLVARLEQGGAGQLQLPMMLPMMVACSRYRLTEEQRFGGYCVFDMSFVEQGASPFTPTVDPTENLVKASQALKDQVVASISRSRVSPRPILTGRVSGGVPFPTGSRGF